MAASRSTRFARSVAGTCISIAALVAGGASTLHAQGTCFARWATAIPYAATHPHGSAVGDWNGDGILDFAIAFEGGVHVFVGTGAAPLTGASFSGPAIIPVSGTPFAVIAADVNGDGIRDLVTANIGGTVAVLTGNGDGTFGAPLYFTAGTAPFDLVAADFDGDGRLDLAVSDNACATGGVSVLFGLSPVVPGQPRFSAPQVTLLGCNPALITTADFNGDHRPDLAIAVYGTGKLHVLINVGGPALFSSLTVASGLTNPYAVAAADLDADGKVDLVSSSVTGIQVRWGAGNGTFTGITGPMSGFSGGIGIGDQDGDGDLDLACESGGQMRLLLQTTPRTFVTESQMLPMSNVLGTRLVDFDGDGHADLVAALYSAGSVRVVPSTCQSAPDLTPPTPDPVGPGWEAQGRAVGSTASAQSLVTEIPDLSGGVFVLWLEANQVRAQRLRADGQRLWGAAGIALCPGTQAQSAPSAISDGAGGFYASWVQDATGIHRIRLVRMQDSGVPATGWSACGIEVNAVPVSPIASGTAGLALDGSGGVFLSDVEDTPTSTVRLYHYTSTGQLVAGWPVAGIQLDAAISAGGSYANSLSTFIVPNGSGGIIADDSQTYFSSDPISQGSFGTIVMTNASGAITGRAGVGFYSSPTPLGNGQALVRFIGGDEQLHAQAFATNGTSSWNVILGPSALASVPRTAPDGSGGFFFVWDATGSQSADVFGRRLTSAGSPASGWASVQTTLISAAGDQREALPLSDGTGGFILVWRDQRSGDQDIYYTRFDAFGHVIPGWSPSGTALVTLPGVQRRPLAVLAEPISAIAVWEDLRSGTAQLYAQKIALDQPVAALASVELLSSTPTRTTLRWQVTGLAEAVRVERSERAGEWVAVDAATFTGDGLHEWVDDRVLSGRRLGYRLVGTTSGSTIPGSEVWIDAPTELVLALRGFDPNPSIRGAAVSFTLPVAAPAELRLFDVSGRAVVSRDVGSLGAGRHRIDLGNLPVGFYVLRLEQSGSVRIQRGTVLR